jgi:hypothetical protein
MPGTYEPIQTTTLNSGSGSIVFSSIPQTYTDLVLIYDAAVDTGVLNRIRFNSDTTSTNYRCLMFYGDGSSSSNSPYDDSWIYNLPPTINSRMAGVINIQNYTSSSKYKTYISRWDNPASLGTYVTCGTWKNNSAITTVTLSTSSNLFTTGSVFTLYGIKAA